MLAAVEAHNRRQAKGACLTTLRESAERVTHFVGRIATLGKTTAEVVVVLLRVDDPHGGPLSEALMPGYDWAPVRAMGMVPYARGLAGREGIQETVDLIDAEVGARLREMVDVPVVVVMDRGVCEVFYATEARP